MNAKQAVVVRTETTPYGYGLCSTRVLQDKWLEALIDKELQAILNIASSSITLSSAQQALWRWVNAWAIGR